MKKHSGPYTVPYDYAFDLADFRPDPAKAITAAKLWENYEYFLRAVIPEAERYGVRLALHPDDPPVPRLGDVERIMISRENIRRAVYEILPSPSLGITFCQANFYIMGENLEETIAEFADDVIAKGATPVICSPVANAGYRKNAKADEPFALNTSRRTYGDYAKAVAKEKSLAYVDMTALTAAELAKLGKDGALALYVGDATKKGKPIFDTTHPAKTGAKRFAELFVADVKARDLPIAKLFK